MTGHLPHDASRARNADLRARADAHRRAHRDPAPGHDQRLHVPAAQSIAIRRATDADRIAIERLAALDEVAVCAGEYLIAEVEHEAQAAIHVESGAAMADPFRPTADLVALLGLRAARLRESTVLAGRHGLRARLRSLYRPA